MKGQSLKCSQRWTIDMLPRSCMRNIHGTRNLCQIPQILYLERTLIEQRQRVMAALTVIRYISRPENQLCNYHGTPILSKLTSYFTAKCPTNDNLNLRLCFNYVVVIRQIDWVGSKHLKISLLLLVAARVCENYSGVRLTNPQAWRRDPVHETVIIHLARSRE
jgi:hypothetical protein